MNKIEFESTLDDAKLTVTVRKPSVQAREKAKLVDAKAFREAVEAGAFRRNQLKLTESPEQIQEMMKLQEQIAANARKVPDAQGKVKDKGVSKEEAKKAAFQMHLDRMMLQQLSAERIDAESRTAESIARNASFDYLVSACCFKPDGSLLFQSVDDYKERNNRDEAIASECAMNFALLDQGMSPDWRKDLPEVKYLEQIKFFKDDEPVAEELFELADDTTEPLPSSTPEPMVSDATILPSQPQADAEAAG